MPHSQYIPRRHPPSLVDRYYLDPLGATISAGSILVGTLLIPSIAPGFLISGALDGLPWWVLIVLSAALLVGGARFLHAALAPRKSWSKLDIMRVKRGGATAFACGWTGYGIAVLSTGNPEAIVPIIMAASLAVGYAGKARALLISEREIERRLEPARPDEG